MLLPYLCLSLLIGALDCDLSPNRSDAFIADTLLAFDYERPTAFDTKGLRPLRRLRHCLHAFGPPSIVRNPLGRWSTAWTIFILIVNISSACADRLFY